VAAAAWQRPEVTEVEGYFLRTQRLGLRCWREDDLELAVSLWGDPEVTRLIDARGRLTPDDVGARLRQEIACEREHGVQYWPMFLLEGGEHVGCCGLRPRAGPGPVYELGVHVRSRHWRRGFAEEAAGAVIGHAFTRLGASGLFAGHNPGNHASRGLLQKLGFRHTHDELYPPTGLQHPSYLLPRPDSASRA
jgi:RimJ/RimL family protein N-acetyltransferase